MNRSNQMSNPPKQTPLPIETTIGYARILRAARLQMSPGRATHSAHPPSSASKTKSKSNSNTIFIAMDRETTMDAFEIHDLDTGNDDDGDAIVDARLSASRPARDDTTTATTPTATTKTHTPTAATPPLPSTMMTPLPSSRISTNNNYNSNNNNITKSSKPSTAALVRPGHSPAAPVCICLTCERAASEAEAAAAVRSSSQRGAGVRWSLAGLERGGGVRL